MSFIFFHVPKCGGMSLRWGMREAALKSGVPEDKIADWEYLVHPGPDPLIGKEVIACHMCWGTHLEAGHHDAPTYTMLRSPVKRVISAFYYVFDRYRFYDGFIRSTMKPEYADMARSWGVTPHLDDCPIGLVENFLDSQLSTYIFHWGIEWEWPHEKSVEKACDRLRDDFSGFGIMEQMDDSLKVLNDLWPYEVPIRMRHDNVGIRRTPPNEEVTALIKDKINLDQMIYDYGVELFQERYG